MSDEYGFRSLRETHTIRRIAPVLFIILAIGALFIWSDNTSLTRAVPTTSTSSHTPNLSPPTTPTTTSFNFTMTNSGTITLGQGGSSSNTITVTLVSGTTQTVTLACTNLLPQGASCLFSPGSGSPSYTSTLTIKTLATTPLGSFIITVTGTGGGLTKLTQFALTVESGNPVGGAILPIDTIAILAPYIALVAAIIATAITTIYITRHKHTKETISANLQI
jgi:hypothetical protein